MKKLDNYLNSLDVLKDADFNQASDNDIYRTGIVGQFNLTFELAWKALQLILQINAVEGSQTGSPRDILKLGYNVGYISDADVWMLMLKKRNLSVHIYDEEEIDELIILIRDSFVPALITLAETLKQKAAEAEENSWD